MRIIRCHFRKRPIREDDIGRDSRLVCQFLALLSQDGEQRVVVLQLHFPFPFFLDPLRFLNDAHNCLPFSERFQCPGGETQSAILAFLFQISHLHELAGEVHPLLLGQFCADAIRRELVVAPAQHFLIFRAEQNVRDMTRAKFLVRAFDTGQELLRRDGDVSQCGGGGGAVVAVGAVVGFVRFAEVVEQRFAATGQLVFRIADNGIQMSNRDAFFIAFFLVDEIVDLGDIRIAVKQGAVRGQTIAPRAPDFLIITFDALGQIVVDDKAHVRLVDAHPKGDGGDDDLRVVAGEGFLIFTPVCVL